MSKMTPAEAIQLLHNRQYMQYKGNGKAVFIHPLTDEEVQMVESLISSQASLIARQHRMIQRACEQFAAIGIGCPASVDKVDWPECDISCEVSKNEAECWLKWLEQEWEAQP